MKNWIHFLDCSRTVCNFAQHCLASRIPPFSLESFWKTYPMRAHLGAGGLPTKTQSLAPSRREKQRGRERICACAVLWGAGGCGRKGWRGCELSERKSWEKLTEAAGGSGARTVERSASHGILGQIYRQMEGRKEACKYMLHVISHLRFSL